MSITCGRTCRTILLLLQTTGRRRQCDGKVYFHFVWSTPPRGLAHDSPPLGGTVDLTTLSHTLLVGVAVAAAAVVLVDRRGMANTMEVSTL